MVFCVRRPQPSGLGEWPCVAAELVPKHLDNPVAMVARRAHFQTVRDGDGLWLTVGSNLGPLRVARLVMAASPGRRWIVQRRRRQRDVQQGPSDSKIETGLQREKRLGVIPEMKKVASKGHL